DIRDQTAVSRTHYSGTVAYTLYTPRTVRGDFNSRHTAVGQSGQISMSLRIRSGGFNTVRHKILRRIDCLSRTTSRRMF
ncbi:hypothetical protein LSH36_184g11015, partial [Paralvinella palmiformis]